MKQTPPRSFLTFLLRAAPSMTKTVKRKRPLFAVVPFGGYPFDVMLAVGATTQQVATRLNRRLATPLTVEQIAQLECPGRGRTVSLPTGQTVLRLEQYDGRPFHRALLAHEVFHAVAFLFDRIGIRLSNDSDEAFAYAIQDLTRRLTEVLDR